MAYSTSNKILLGFALNALSLMAINGSTIKETIVEKPGFLATALCGIVLVGSGLKEVKEMEKTKSSKPQKPNIF